MFFKRLGVLRTEDMMKIFNNVDIDVALRDLLEKNKENAENLQHIEVLCKKALGKLSSKTDKIELSCGKYRGHFKERNKNILNQLKLDENDELFLAIVNGAIEYTTAEVNSASKSRQNDINNLYAAAKKEKRRIKDLQKKICDELKQWERIIQKMEMINETVVSGKMISGLWCDDYRKTVHRASPKMNTLKRLRARYDRLFSKAIQTKNNIQTLLDSCGVRREDIEAICQYMQCPLLISDSDLYPIIKEYQKVVEASKKRNK